MAGDNVGVLLRGIERDGLERGQVLAKPNSIQPHTNFEANVYVLSKEEGGRHTPFFAGYRPQFYFRTTDVTGAVTELIGADGNKAEMCMPGRQHQGRRWSCCPIRPSPWTKTSASPSAKAAAPSVPAWSSRSFNRRYSFRPATAHPFRSAW